MPDPTLSAAIKEAYVNAKGVVYHTLELRHPKFTSPVRVVRGYGGITARLEASAPANPGEYVDFVNMPFELTRPEQSSTGVPSITITIDNVSREIVANIELALASTDLVVATYREYLDSDLSGPQNDPPTHLDIMTCSASVFTVTATAGFTNLNNKKFPTEEYSTERFPGLVA